MSAASRIAFAALAFVSVGALSAPSASAADALNYAQGYLLTGNYVVSGVDLTPQANPPNANGLATATFHFKDSDKTSIPPDADIVAAYLYFETVTDKTLLSEAKGATFDGHPILLNDFRSVKKSKQDLTGPLASCWSSGTPLTVTEFRADVLRWLPIRPDKDGKATGKRLINDADLIAHGQPFHQVQLPTRSGNHVPESAGASLVIVYRDPSQPLRKVVFYDGVHVQSSLSELTTQSLAGFYQSSANKSAQITYLLSSGQPNKNERIFFSDGAGLSKQISLADPVNSSGPSSQRGWSTVKYDVSSYMNPVGKAGLTGFGETARTSIDHAGGGAYDCLALSAVIFSTAVADVDGDGLPDGIEDAASPLTDADGKQLPDLHMGGQGASSGQKDLFVEFNAMWAPAGTTYGSDTEPFAVDPVTGAVIIQKQTDPVGHNHMPTPDMLKMIGDAYINAGVHVHFDVGKWGYLSGYHAPQPAKFDPSLLGKHTHVDWIDDYTSSVADAYLVPSDYAFGGEVIQEVACKPTNDPKTGKPTSHCQFPDFPGTVGWKFGLELYRDEPVGDNGEQISDYAAWRKGSSHRRRFDRKRLGLYHYVLYGHARGNPQSDDPNNGIPFHHPTTASGVADLPGANVLVTLGLWDDFVGRPFVRASTTFHELGHNLGLWHGGAPAVWGNAHPASGAPTSTTIEANCKPNYQSSMSYLFQVLGLVGHDGTINVDYSSTDLSDVWPNGLNELSLSNLNSLWGTSAKYQPAWFAPSDSPLAKDLLASPPSHRFCDGTRFDANKPSPMMARVHSVDGIWSIHWDGDSSYAIAPDNINFDGVQPMPVPGKAAQPLPMQVFGTYMGWNDWKSIRLDQMGAGRKTVKFQGGGDFADFGSGDFTDFGSGDFSDFGSGDFTDFGSGDFSDFGSGDFSDFGSGDFTDFGSGVFQIGSGDFSDFGSGDFADFGSGDFSDFGSGDFLDFGSGTERQELDYDTARALSPANPYALTACVIGTNGCTPASPGDPAYHRVQLTYSAPTVGKVLGYVAQRRLGDASSTNPWVNVPGGSSTTTLIDPDQLPDGQPFTYHVRAQFDDLSFGPWSAPLAVPVNAVNVAPHAAADPDPTTGRTAFGLNEDDQTGLTVNVLTNDNDDDSPHASLRATLVNDAAVQSTLAGHGSVTLSPTGTFTYVPAPDFEGTITFHYTANDGVWTDGVNTIAMSPDSAPSTAVTVQVISRHTTTSIISSLNPSVYGNQVTFTATVAPVTRDSERVAAGVPTLGTPAGTVAFTDTINNILIPLGTATLNSDGIATFTTAATALPAGSHHIVAAYCGDPEAYCGSVFYGSASDPITQVVQKAPATVNVTTYSVTYDATPHSASYTLAGVNGETGAAVGTVSLTSTHTDAGTYTDSWTFTGSANYNDIAQTFVTDTINKANAKIGIGQYVGTYDGSAHGLQGSATGVLGESLTASLNLGSSFTDAPGGTAHWTFTGGTNYNDASGNGNVRINKAGSTTTMTCPQPATYTGSAITCTVSVALVGVSTPFVPAASDIQYTGDNVNASSSSTPNATASYTYPGDTNHVAAPGATSEQFLIIKASSSTSLSCPATASWTGSPVTPCTATVTAINVTNPTATITYTNNVNVGTASATATYSGDSNHFGSSSGPKSFIITN